MEYPLIDVKQMMNRQSVSKDDKILNIVSSIVKPTDNVLDFGCGHQMQDVTYMRNNKHKCTYGHDFHTTYAPSYGDYSVVYLKNVLNNIPSEMSLYLTLLEAAGYLNPNGKVIADYPAKNRMMKMGNMKVRAFLEYVFNQVFTLTTDQNGYTPIWIARVDVSHNEEDV